MYPHIDAHLGTRAYILLTFLRHSKSIWRYLYTTNQLERLAKEVKCRAKVVEAFCGEGAVERLLYWVFSNLDERLAGYRLRSWKVGWEAIMRPRHSKEAICNFQAPGAKASRLNVEVRQE